jgi:catechol 2,3-dioxygenase-like lactoylglutathione lyase family enzyme
MNARLNPPVNEMSASLSHAVLFCFDFDAMLDFYRTKIGMHLSDIGHARGNRIAFLTFDPDVDHHQIAIASGRKGERDAGALNHIAFRVPSMAALRRRHAHLTAQGVAHIEPISHATWFSVYWRDPENNRLEFFWDVPYYVEQPIVEPLDLSLSDEEMLASVIAKYGKHPSFKPMKQWKEETLKALA